MLMRVCGLTALLAGLASPAFAGSAANWDGVYAGLSVGVASSDVSIGAQPNPFFFNSGFPSDAIVASFIQNNEPATLRSDQPTGGGQIGFNWQHGNLVAGLEADVTFYDGNSSLSRGDFVDSSNTIHRYAQSADSTYLASLRPRVGVAFGNVLLYGTGGVAVGDMKVTDTIVLDHSPGLTFSSSTSKTMTGWVVGGGAEFQMDRHWSLKGEYLHTDLGSVDFLAKEVLYPQLFSVSHSAHLLVDVAHIGLNYRF